MNFKLYAFELSESGGYCEGGNGIEIILDGSETDVDYELFLEGISTGIILAGIGNPLSFGYQTDVGIYTVIGNAAFCSEQMVGTPYIFINYPPESASTPEGEENVCSPDTTEYSVATVENADTLYWYLDPSDAGEIIGSGETISIAWSVSTQVRHYCRFRVSMIVVWVKSQRRSS